MVYFPFTCKKSLVTLNGWITNTFNMEIFTEYQIEDFCFVCFISFFRQGTTKWFLFVRYSDVIYNRARSLTLNIDNCKGKSRSDGLFLNVVNETDFDDGF